MIGVLVVDDHLQFRQAAGELIEATPGFELLGEADCGEEAMRMIEQLDPALVLLDVRLPGIDGIETARRITSLRPHQTVFLVSTADRADLPQGLRSSGAATFVAKRDLCSGALRELWAKYGGGA